MKFCVNMHLDNTTSRTLLNFKVIGQRSRSFFSLLDQGSGGKKFVIRAGRDLSPGKVEFMNMDEYECDCIYCFVDNDAVPEPLRHAGKSV